MSVIECAETVNRTEYKRLLKNNSPKDKYFASLLFFFYLGLIGLLPWRCFAVPYDYWMFKFRNVSETSSDGNNKTELQLIFTTYISSAAGMPLVLFFVVNLLISKWFSIHSRIVTLLIVYLSLFVLNTIFVRINTDKWQYVFFCQTMVTVLLLNVAVTFMTTTIFEAASNFPPLYISANLGGQAASAIFCSVAEIISLFFGFTSINSAFAYFLIVNVSVALCIGFYFVVRKTDNYKYYVHEEYPTKGNKGEDTIEYVSWKHTYRKLWPQYFAVGFSYMFSACVYPGITVLVRPENFSNGSAWNTKYFVPTINYLLYSIGDCHGRISAYRTTKLQNGNLLIFSVARVSLVVLILLCNEQPKKNIPVIFKSDIIFIVAMYLLAYSNGFVYNKSTTNIFGIAIPQEMKTATNIHCIFIGIGLCLGSIISIFLVKIV